MNEWEVKEDEDFNIIKEVYDGILEGVDNFNTYGDTCVVEDGNGEFYIPKNYKDFIHIGTLSVRSNTYFMCYGEKRYIRKDSDWNWDVICGDLVPDHD